MDVSRIPNMSGKRAKDAKNYYLKRERHKQRSARVVHTAKTHTNVPFGSITYNLAVSGRTTNLKKNVNVIATSRLSSLNQRVGFRRIASHDKTNTVEPHARVLPLCFNR